MDWEDLIPNEELDLGVKVITRKTALLLRLEPKIVERLKWKERRVKIQVSLKQGKKRVRIVPATSGWDLVDKKTKGAEISVRQLVATGKYTRKCEAAIEGEALVISLPDDFELKNPSMVMPARARAA
jgi:hypothetical protein